MQIRSKALIAASIAATLGIAGLAASANADGNSNWRGWRMGNMMGVRDHMMGRCGNDRRQGMGHMRQGVRNFADRYDTNKDGKITQAEIDASRAEWFKKYDANNDGKLSIDEYQNLWLAERRRTMVRAFQKLDIDGTGAITLEVFEAPLVNIVERLDQNNDGALSRDDMKSWRQHQRGRWGMLQGKDQSRMSMMDDDDNNGTLSRDDMQAWRGQNRGHWGMMQGQDQSRMPMMQNDDGVGDNTGDKADQPQQ